VAKTEKPATGKAPTAKTTPAKTPAGKAPASKTSSGKPEAEEPAGKTSGGMGKVGLFVIAAVAAAAVAGGIFYLRGGFNHDDDASGPKTDPNIAELMAPGPTEDIFLGKADAPNTIVEYASMTCPHCAQFHNTVLPELKAKYIDTGQARLVLREFPLDGLALAAIMLARCAGPDRYYPMVGGLFETQHIWAVPGTEGREKLLLIAKQAGFSKESFDKCIDDQTLRDKVVAETKRAHDKFGVDSTPTFFVNGKRLTGEHELKDFDAALGGKPEEGKPAGGASPAEGSAAPPEGSTAPAEGGASPPEGTTPGQ
jgi:protein-disulfide isomerase